MTRTQSDSKIAKSASIPENQLTDKEKYMKYFELGEVGGESVQFVKEMQKCHVILKVALDRSPP